MGWLEVIFTFFLTWWIVIFMVLPLGVQREEAPALGHDHGAPKNANFKYKAKLTTILSLLITFLIYCLTSFGLFSLREIFAAEPEKHTLIDHKLCERVLAREKNTPPADYIAGEDVKGQPVVEADLAPQIEIDTDNMTFEITVDAAHYLGLQTPAGVETTGTIGQIIYKNKAFYWNDQPLTSEQANDLVTRCETDFLKNHESLGEE